MQRLKVTDLETGKIWVENNCPHSWQDLCLFIMVRYSEFQLTYCDIECLAKGQSRTMDGIIEQWYMLDECGRYEPMPDEFKVEEIIC